MTGPEMDKAYRQLLRTGIDALGKGLVQANLFIEDGDFVAASAALLPLVGGVSQQMILCNAAARLCIEHDNASVSDSQEKEKR